jgi:hypothetical protein
VPVVLKSPVNIICKWVYWNATVNYLYGSMLRSILCIVSVNLAWTKVWARDLLTPWPSITAKKCRADFYCKFGIKIKLSCFVCFLLLAIRSANANFLTIFLWIALGLWKRFELATSVALICEGCISILLNDARRLSKKSLITAKLSLGFNSIGGVWGVDGSVWKYLVAD